MRNDDRRELTNINHPICSEGRRFPFHSLTILLTVCLSASAQNSTSLSGS